MRRLAVALLAALSGCQAASSPEAARLASDSPEIASCAALADRLAEQDLESRRFGAPRWRPGVERQLERVAEHARPLLAVAGFVLDLPEARP